MLNLKSFHLATVFLAIVVTAGVGTWGVMHQHSLAGWIALAISVLLVAYVGYFAATARQIRE